MRVLVSIAYSYVYLPSHAPALSPIKILGLTRRSSADTLPTRTVVQPVALLNKEFNIVPIVSGLWR